MKKTFYLSVTFNRLVLLFLAAMLVCGVTTKAQLTFNITFPNTPPATSDPSLDQNDALGAIETGVRFRVTQPGTITRILFLKGNGVLGVHTGHLWSNTGTLLDSSTFSESASGWQTSSLMSVHINAGVNYVASVFSNLGDYASENDTWAGGTDFGPPTNPIKVIAWLNDPGTNGIYIFNSTSAFPNIDGTADNYWIDITFVLDFALPVTLSDFRASVNSSDVVLNWKTDHEFNNKGFEIQRSNNGSDWYALNFLNSAGDGSVTRNYTYTDKSLAPGVYYYRLKQTDLDGKSSFSSIVSATIAGKGKVSLFQNYPNPFTGSSRIRFDLPLTQHARLSILDMAGREVKVLTDKFTEAGTHIVTIDATTLRSQIYLVRLQTESGVLTKQILVQ